MTDRTTRKRPTKGNLSGSHRNLLEQMQAVNYGRILNIEVRQGALHFTPMTRVERHVRFGGENRPRPECGLEDFALKNRVVEFLHAIERMGDGLILKLEIKGGLPFDMTVEERPA